MRTLKLVIEYDGTDFVGWQTQRNGRSVQEEIEKVLAQVLQDDVPLIGAGRTDSGVHARGQVASFRTESPLPPHILFRALNGLLPGDVAVRSVDDAPAEFHARFSAKERVYRYYIASARAAVGRQYEWFVKYDLDLRAMESIAGRIVGDHDFRSFCKYEADVDNHRCSVTASSWTEAGDRLVYEIRANRFLHGMVRALVGTMVDIGRGHTAPEAFDGILASRDRQKAGMAAPPHGLFLEQVVY